MADDGHGMALSRSVGAVDPEALVVVYVVASHALDDRAEHIVELLVGDERSPLTFLFFRDVVGSLTAAYLYYVVIFSSHRRKISCVILVLLDIVLLCFFLGIRGSLRLGASPIARCPALHREDARGGTWRKGS